MQPHRITLRSIDDLQCFVNDYRPTVDVVAQIINHKLQVFPDIQQYQNAGDLMDALRRHLDKYRGQDLPLFIE